MDYPQVKVLKSKALEAIISGFGNTVFIVMPQL
jgi:hypothetical protein